MERYYDIQEKLRIENEERLEDGIILYKQSKVKFERWLGEEKVCKAIRREGTYNKARQILKENGLPADWAVHMVKRRSKEYHKWKFDNGLVV